MRCTVLAVGGALVLTAAAAAAQLPPGAEEAWTGAVADWRSGVESEGVVGASLALVVGDRLERLETYGLADRADGEGAGDRPVDARTIYHWASITKTFTAITIMQLRDRGLLALDDPIVRYVPEVRDVYDPFGPIEEITIRHLLAHASGFRGGTWPWAGGEPWQPHEPTEWRQLVAMIPYTRIHFEPGSRFGYSNPGIVFLGRVIERVTGDVFEAYVDKNVFRPLGMREAYFDVTPWHLRPHRSNHFFVRDGEVRAGGLDFNTGITVSNGGLNAPVGDMARYLSFLLGTPRADQDAAAVLSRASLEEMWRTVVPIGESGIGRESMGLSFFLYGTPGGLVVGHTGTQRAFYSFFAIDAAAGVGVIGAFNTGGVGGPPDTARLRIETRAALVNRVFPTFRAGGR